MPWRTIIRHAPTILEAARGFYGNARRPSVERGPDHRIVGGMDALRRVVETLDERSAEQARLVAELAQQVAEMAIAMQVLRARLTLAVWGASIAGALGLVALVVALWYGSRPWTH